jgi:hypothetical protein
MGGEIVMVMRIGDIKLESSPRRLPTPEKVTTVYKALAGNDIKTEFMVRDPDAFMIFAFTEETGGISRFTYKKLLTLSRIRNAIFLLYYHGTEYRVMFRKGEPGGPVQMAPGASPPHDRDALTYFGRIFFKVTSERDFPMQRLQQKPPSLDRDGERPLLPQRL